VRLWLVPDPDNKHDKKAISVVADTELKSGEMRELLLGYVPAARATAVRRFCRKRGGFPYRVLLTGFKLYDDSSRLAAHIEVLLLEQGRG
jgi:hypothetical protein